MLPIILTINVFVILFSISTIKNKLKNKHIAYFLTGALFLYVSIVILVTENNSIDMPRYLTYYYTFSDLSLSESLRLSPSEPLFVLFQWIAAQISTHPHFFYLSIWILFGVVLLVSLKNLLPSHLVTITFFLYINFFIFFNYITNVVRQGFAIVFLILALSKVLKAETITSKILFYLLIPPLFHKTAIPLSIMILLFSFFKIKLKYLNYLWLFHAILFITNLNSTIFNRLAISVDEIAIYSSGSVLNNYGGGTNRWDFLIFSALFLGVFNFLNNKVLNHGANYERLLKYYIIFNIYFLTFGFVAFSDRIAAYSWFLIPILLTYPFKSTRKHNNILLFLFVVIFFLISLFQGSILYNQQLFY